MRKLMRSIARHNMKKQGLSQINKRPWFKDVCGVPFRGDSYFSQHWREYF